MKTLILLCVTGFRMIFASACASGIDVSENSIQSLRVLIITPDPKVGFGAGIKKLLNENKVEADIMSFLATSVGKAAEYDVLIVTGLGRRLNKAIAALDYGKPILSYGPFGSTYLGLLDLKNGFPYT